MREHRLTQECIRVFVVMGISTTPVLNHPCHILHYVLMYAWYQLPISLIEGQDFLEYRSEDKAVAQAFRLLPDSCLTRISRAASSHGTVTDHNLALLSSSTVTSLWLNGRFSDKVSILHVHGVAQRGQD